MSRPLTSRQRQALRFASRGWVSLYYERSMPSLIARGLIVEVRPQSNRRSGVYELTDAGRAALKQEKLT